MALTTYLEWDDQTTGSNDNTWGDVLDANQTIFELAIARVLGIATTGGSTTLTTAQNRYPVIRLTGALVSNATIVVRTAEKNWTFINHTTGAFSVTVKTSAGTGKTLPRGRATRLYCDGTNVENLRQQGIPHAAAGGTADAITGTFEPPTVANDLEDGYLWSVEAGSANTSTTPTFNPDATGALTIKKNGGQALAAGDIRAAGHKLLLMYDKSGGHVELLNPYSAVAAASLTAAGIVELATTTETLTGTDAARAATPDSVAALWEQGSNVTDGAAITIGEGGYHKLITSTTAITSFTVTTDKAGRKFWVEFDTVRTLTDNASIDVPGGSYTTAQGDVALIKSNGDGTVKVLLIMRASGQPVVAPAQGAWTSVATLTPSGVASVEQGSLSGYKALRITGINVMPASDGAQFRIRLSSDGSSYLATNYDSNSWRGSASNNASTAFQISDPDNSAQIGNASGDGGLNFEVVLHSFNAAQKTAISGLFNFGDTAGNHEYGLVQGWHTGQTAMQAIQFLFSSGNIASGTILIEGLA